MPARFNRGLNLFEFGVVVVLFSLLVGIFLHRFATMQEYSEKVAMEMTVMNIRTGLRYKLAELMAAGQSGEVAALLEANPVNWLETPPENYAGSFSDPSKADIQPGSWYFDQRQKQLVYRLNRHANFESHTGIPERRFQLNRMSAAPNRTGSVLPLMTGLGLVEASPTRWFQE